jgi:hypothetical protein
MFTKERIHMNADQLHESEQQGRRFATALVDAGYGRKRVIDLAFVPSWRSGAAEGCTRARAQLSFTDVLFPTNATSADLRDRAGKRRAFMDGIFAVLEERGL